jgi:hypothetical protein
MLMKDGASVKWTDETMRKGIRLEMWHRTAINEAGLVAHYFLKLVGLPGYQRDS